MACNENVEKKDRIEFGSGGGVVREGFLEDATFKLRPEGTG